MGLVSQTFVNNGIAVTNMQMCVSQVAVSFIYASQCAYVSSQCGLCILFTEECG